MTSLDLILRTIWGLVNANIAILSIYLFIRGYATRYILKNFWKHIPASLEKFDLGEGESSKTKAKVSYTWQGNEYTQVDPKLYTVADKSKIHLYIRPSDLSVKYDTWTYNGTGIIILGGAVLAVSLVLFYFLSASAYHLY